MIYLAELLTVLIPEETKKLETLKQDLSHKEVEIFSAIIQDKDISISALSQNYCLTENHVYKILSVLTRKVLDFLEPEGIIAQLYFISRKDIFPLFRHELVKHFKKTPIASIKEQLRFYYVGFELLQRGSYINRDEQLIQEFAEALLTLGKREILEPYIQVRMLRSQFFYHYSLNQLEKMEEIYTLVKDIVAPLKPETHALTLFHAYQLFFLYHNYRSAQTNIEQYLLKAMDMVSYESDFLSVEDTIQVQLKIAEAYLVTLRYMESFSFYKEIASSFSNLVRFDVYHQSKFLVASIVLKEQTWAEQILQNSFEPYLHSNNLSRATMAALNYAKYEFSIENFLACKKYLNLAKETNQKSFFIHYEVEIRIIDVLMNYFTEEPDFVLQAIKKDMKYLNSKGFSLESSTYMKYLYIIQQWIKMQEKNPKKQKWTSKCTQILADFEKKYMGVYWFYLKKVITEPKTVHV